MATTVTIEKDHIVIRVPLQTPTPSSSGKTLIVGSTGGFYQSDAKDPVSGKVISVSVNATVKG